ncbi:MAG: archaellin/type IV pilin N-terminal domain-containing protein [Armatimonadota bacterium]|nr:archaellin/type IV pilin N-terminal domain-containing protein [Armatimonadota bacterium]
MSSWKQKQVSPVVAWVIIIAVVVVAAAVIWRYTGSPGRRGMTEEQRRQMEQMFGNQAPAPGRTPSPNAPAPAPR